MKYSNLVPYMICEFTINDYNGINSIVKQNVFEFIVKNDENISRIKFL